MHHFFLVRIIALVSNYGYYVLFPVAVFEGPLAAMVAGAFAASGGFDFFIAFIILSVADLVGDSLYYALGRYGHNHFLAGIGSRLGLTEERIAPLAETFQKHNWKLLLVSKTQALGSLVLYFAGATRMQFARYLCWCALGTVPKVLLFELIGYFLGQGVIHSSTKYVDLFGIASAAIVLLLLIAYWLVKAYLEREFESKERAR